VRHAIETYVETTLDTEWPADGFASQGRGPGIVAVQKEFAAAAGARLNEIRKAALAMVMANPEAQALLLQRCASRD
jgi:hypothetical protein